MPRGGQRTGSPGTNYSNRTDMQQGPRALPVTAAPGQQYGAAKAQRDAQKVVPISTPGGASPAVQDPHQIASDFQFPTEGMTGPTTNPNEPWTAGLPVGPGPGPEALGPQSNVQGQWTNAQQVLQTVALASPDAAYLLSQFQGRGM